MPIAGILGSLCAHRGPRLIHWSTFTAPNDTPLASYTPEVGSPWVERVGDQRVVDNQAHTLSGWGVYTVDTECYKSDVRIECDVYLSNYISDGGAGVLFRSADVNTGQMFYYDAGNQRISLYWMEIQNAIYNIVQNTPYVVNNMGVLYHTVIELSGPNMKFTVNDVEVYQHSSAQNQNATRHGLSGSRIHEIFDNFKVYG